MRYLPGQLRYRIELLQPTDSKTATGNTKGEYVSYGTRYAALIQASGTDGVNNDQDVATRGTLWVIRYDANVKASWIVRYGGQDYFIEAAPVDPDNGAKRFWELRTVAIDSIALSTDALSAPVLSDGDTGSTTQAISWTVPDGVVTGYRVYVNGSLYATVTGTSFVVAGLTPETEYAIYVQAFNSYATGPASNTVTVTTSAAGAGGYFGRYFGGG